MKETGGKSTTKVRPEETGMGADSPACKGEMKNCVTRTGYVGDYLTTYRTIKTLWPIQRQKKPGEKKRKPTIKKQARGNNRHQSKEHPTSVT